MQGRIVGDGVCRELQSRHLLEQEHGNLQNPKPKALRTPLLEGFWAQRPFLYEAFWAILSPRVSLGARSVGFRVEVLSHRGLGFGVHEP